MLRNNVNPTSAREKLGLQYANLEIFEYRRRWQCQTTILRYTVYDNQSWITSHVDCDLEYGVLCNKSVFIFRDQMLLIAAIYEQYKINEYNLRFSNVAIILNRSNFAI